jgi:hypothetical protein
MDNLSLIHAAKTSDYGQAERLVKSGADLNQSDEQGWTALNFAAGKGDLPMVKLLIEAGADVFKVGRDRRTPYMIALAAGRVAVVQYLKTIEDGYPGEKPSRPERQYCKAYYLRDLRQYPGWSEERIDCDKNGDEQLRENAVVFVHQDLTVTASMWHAENVLFNKVNADWEAFCANSLHFKVPTDLDLTIAVDAET